MSDYPGTSMILRDENFLEVAKTVAESTDIQYILATLQAMQAYVTVHALEIQASVLDETASLLRTKVLDITTVGPHLGEAVEQAIRDILLELRPCLK